MKKIILTGAVIIIVLLGVTYSTTKVNAPVADIKNLTYKVDGQTITLKNGTSATLSMFGEPVYGDLNKDGVEDAAILLVYTPGGSGTFYYAVLAINKKGIYEPTDLMFLGDRIAPQTVEIKEGRAVYNIAERKGTDPMSTPPSIGKSIWVHYDATSNNIGEWVKGFEGESSSIQ